MLKYSLCIEPVFEDLDFYDRIKQAAQLGCDAIEFWDPADKDAKKIASLCAANNIEVAICCLKNAWDIRLNEDIDILKKNVVESIAFAKEMGCKSLIGLSGDITGYKDNQKNILIENLKRISDILVKEGITLNIEALNSIVDHKGYYLDSSYVGFEIIKSVGCDNVKLLYDVYHMQIMEGNLIDNITNNIKSIGHFHSAGVPGRKEHMDCEINYPAIIKTINNTEYNKYFGLEYWATYDSKKSLVDVLNYLKK